MSDYLSEEEQVERIKSWWQQNGTSLIVGVVLVVAGIVGYRWYGSYSAEQAAAASDLYEDYVAASAVEADRAAVLEEIGNKIPDSGYAVLAHLDSGAKAFAAGELDAAIGHLSNAVDAGKGSHLEGLARLRLARALQEAERTDEALAELGRVQGKGYESLAAELRGDILYGMDDRAGASTAYRVAADLTGEGEMRPLLQLKINNTADAAAAEDASDAE